MEWAGSDAGMSNAYMPDCRYRNRLYDQLYGMVSSTLVAVRWSIAS